jgi:hypothetical protein
MIIIMEPTRRRPDKGIIRATRAWIKARYSGGTVVGMVVGTLVWVIILFWLDRLAGFPPAHAILLMANLAFVVFLTYVVLALMGFKVSQQGVVDVPRIYAWGLLCAIVISVFGVLFYLLVGRS